MMSWRVLLTLVALTGQDAPRLNDLLARVARYVQQFEQDFEIILSRQQGPAHGRARRFEP